MNLSNEMIVALIGVGFGVVGFLLAIWALLRSSKGSIRDIADEAIYSFKKHDLDNRIHLVFNEMYNKKMTNEPAQTVVKYISQPAPAPKPNNEVKPAVAASQSAQQPASASPKTEEASASAAPAAEENREEGIQPGTEIKLETPITLYASMYMNKAFKKVSTTPDDYTIYNITTSPSAPNSGVITIDLNAYAKVGTTPDFLDEACIVSGNGSNVKVTKPGTVVKEGENWIVTEQIEVELN